MAVLAPTADWNATRDTAMDVPSNSNSSSRQRSSPANEQTLHQQTQHQYGSTQQQQPQHQPQYPYPVQQQPQGSWTPSITAQPFYPSFYQNPHQQQPSSFSPHSPPQMGQPGPYYDPALAQWYQSMMYQQQQGFPRMSPSHQPSPQQRPHNDYFAGNQMPPPPPGATFNPFPSGTPPPHPNNQHLPSGHRNGPGDQQQPGFHPYRRPSRQQSGSEDWRPSAAPQRPYARPDASGSSTSVNSAGSERPRTNSAQSTHSAVNVARSRSGDQIVPPSRARNGSPPVTNSPTRSRTGSNPPSPGASVRGSTPHNRNPSTSSTASVSRQTSASPNAPSSPASTNTSSSTVARPARPSPLSQGNYTAAEKRMSRDDIDLASMRDPTPNAAMMRGGGLKGRLRRALSFNAAQALQEEQERKAEASAGGTSGSKAKPRASTDIAGGRPGADPSSDQMGNNDDAASTATVQTKKKSRAASLFNSRLNASTDNISLSSTVSSASVMIRKLGSMGKLARRNSLAGITSLFKDKEREDGDGTKDKSKDKDKDKDKKGKKKGKNAKSEASVATVSHATAEIDRVGSDWTSGPEMSGLSPAAKLARQHTLKTNAEAEAKQKALQEAAAARAQQQQVNGGGVPAWERNTATGQGSASPLKGGGGVRINEDGTRVFVEDDEDVSDEGHYMGPAGGVQGYNADGWDDDEEWDEGDEDVTIRQGLEDATLDDEENEYDDPEPWAVDIRRSVERTRVPARGILKYAGTYHQDNHSADSNANPSSRLRANSYDSHPGQTSELGPLARIPSPDPDHIDGLHRHPSHSSSHSGVNTQPPSLPPLSFEIPSTQDESGSSKPVNTAPHSPLATHPPEKSNAIFNHPNLSAPALSMLNPPPAAPPLSHRSATAPGKRLAFANNLSVYDTFPATVYDRRSEPATWSRLTPALAQRIKEELNSYKMEEMEVHASSRVHTQFFI